MYKITVVLLTMTLAIVSAQAEKSSINKIGANKTGWTSELSPDDVAVWTVSPMTNNADYSGVENYKKSRRPASGKEFTENDMSPGMKVFRAKIIGGSAVESGKSVNFTGVKSGKELADLLADARKNFNSYDKATQYFLAPLLVAEPLRGIVWRTRKIFEIEHGIGNKATHGQAVQLVRNVIAGVKTYFPTEQWKAGVEFFTQPDPNTKQFESIRDIQKFILTSYVPALQAALEQIQNIYKSDKNTDYVWDNKIGYDMGVFDDGLNRFIGHGQAEKLLALSALSNAIHDSIVFCAYNQDHLISYYGEVGRKFGIDAIRGGLFDNDLGITDKERSKIVKSFTDKGWLSLHKGKDKMKNEVNTGAALMSAAYAFLGWSVKYADDAYKILQGADANNSMLLNPIHYQPISSQNLEHALKNMKAVVSGPTTLRSPVTGEHIEVNLPQFYMSPPKSLAKLMANHWDETGDAENRDIRDSNGKVLKYRNYLRGRATGWDNNEWSMIVPSAKGQSIDYMIKAKRVIRSSRGAGPMFGMVDMFVR